MELHAAWTLLLSSCSAVAGVLFGERTYRNRLAHAEHGLFVLSQRLDAVTAKAASWETTALEIQAEVRGTLERVGKETSRSRTQAQRAEAAQSGDVEQIGTPTRAAIREARRRSVSGAA